MGGVPPEVQAYAPTIVPLLIAVVHKVTCYSANWHLGTAELNQASFYLCTASVPFAMLSELYKHADKNSKQGNANAKKQWWSIGAFKGIETEGSNVQDRDAAGMLYMCFQTKCKTTLQRQVRLGD